MNNMASHLSASKLFNLSGAVALVTGGGTGIGLMCSRALAANGSKVYITGRREQQISAAADEHSAKLDGQLIPLQGDVTSKSDLEQIAKTIHEKEGKLHILINNAGIAGPKTKLEDPSKLSAADYARAHLEGEEAQGWSDVFTTNVTGVFLTTMSMLPLLAAGQQHPPEGYTALPLSKFAPYTPAVINITSISGIVKTNQGHYAYNASKAAANHLTSMLAHELRFHAPFQLRVNALAPGVFPSEMTADVSGNTSAGAGLTHVETGELQDKSGPPGRTGTEEDMASLCLLLACNQYVHGQVVAVDGGFTAATPSTR